jgi:ribosomal protein S12 methylthiotransferase accessory factor
MNENISSQKKLIELYKILEKHSIINQIHDAAVFYDEPPFYYYTAKLKKHPKALNLLGYKTDTFLITSSGLSYFSEEEAFWKCIGETIERLCTSSYQEKEIQYATYLSLKDSKNYMVDPAEYLLKPDMHKIQLGWVKGMCLTEDNNESLIPAQLIFLNYLSKRSEPLLFPTITTGAAGDTDPLHAIIKGIYEVIERDAITSTYLSKIPLPNVNYIISTDRSIDFIYNLLKKYHLHWRVLNATTDLGFPVMISLVIDTTGIGPVFTVGSACSLDPIEAIVKSVSEACMIRLSARHMMVSNSDAVEVTNKPITLNDRIRYWYEKKQMKKLSFWLNNNEKPFSFKRNIQTTKVVYHTLLKQLMKKGYQIYAKDISLPLFKKKYYVYKVIIPGLQPLYLDETRPYIDRKRVNEIANYFGNKEKKVRINTVPHPFL